MKTVKNGGFDALELKITTFESFTSKIEKKIRDIDISTIEQAFRRRTIEGLRNYLQSPVSNTAKLSDYIRHELKDHTPAYLQGRITRFSDSLNENTVNISTTQIEEVKNICSSMNNAITGLIKEINKIVELDTQPFHKEIDLYTFLIKSRDEVLEYFARVNTNVEIYIDADINGTNINADEGHLELIINNLIKNSMESTEKKKFLLYKQKDFIYIPKISIKLHKNEKSKIHLLFTDNGCGIPDNIRDRLYTERCSEENGPNKGFGGIIISKLLNINFGDIQILKSTPEYEGTIQRITLSKFIR